MRVAAEISVEEAACEEERKHGACAGCEEAQTCLQSCEAVGALYQVGQAGKDEIGCCVDEAAVKD